MRRLFLTPPNLPTDSVCKVIKVPNDKLWLGIFNAALLQTLYPWNWEQVNDTDLTIEEATATAQEIFYEYLESGDSCLPLAPYWDEENGGDADGDDLASGFPWYENLADWAVTAFLAVSFTPDAAIEYVTTIRKVRLWFRSRDYGAILRVLVDGIEVGTVDTYSAEPALVEFAYDIPEPVGLMAQADPTGTIRIEHTGTANEDATPTENGFAAEVIRKRLDWEEGGGGGCLRQYRLSESGANQYSDDGGVTWEDASELPDYPEPAPREEPTDDEKICLAARNAVEVLYQTFIVAFEQWEASGDVLDNIAATSGFMATVLGLFIAATWVSVWGFVIFAAGLVLKAFDLITEASWTDEDTKRLTCRLIELATLQPDNTVTFDYATLMADGAGSFGNLIVAGFYQLMMDTIGEAGLNAAGGTTAITSYDCAECDEWEYFLTPDSPDWYWNLENLYSCNGATLEVNGGQYGVVVAESGVNVWRGVNRYASLATLAIAGNIFIPSTTTVTQVAMMYTITGGGSYDAIRRQMSANLNKYCATTFAANPALVDVTITNTNLAWKAALYDGGNGRTVTINAIRFRGTGINPFP